MVVAVSAVQMSVPEDSKDVTKTFRLGWAMAELRGRYQRLLDGIPGAGSTMIERKDYALPLSEERSPIEQAMQVESVVIGLGRELSLDFGCDELAGRVDSPSTKVSEEVARICVLLREESTDARSRIWRVFTELLFHWDAKIQDQLAEESFTTASGYQLGRGLAEVYWALNPHVDDPRDPSCWAFLFGKGRRIALSHRLVRLDRYFPPMVVPAIQESLEAWGAVADNPRWRNQAGVEDALFEQIRLWRDLLIGETNPASLLRVDAVLRNARNRKTLLLVITSFAPEVLVLLAGIALGLVAIVALTNGNSTTAGLIGSLSVFGITVASVIAKVQTTANGLLDRLRITVYTELVAEAITLCPALEVVQTTNQTVDLA